MFSIQYVSHRVASMYNGLYRRRILKHYARAWGCGGEDAVFLKGPTHELPADFSVRLFPPTKHRAYWVYATCSMSQPDDCRGLELHMFSRYRSPEPVELLYVTAHFHRYGEELGWGHTVSFGRPWIDDSHCDHGFISTPYMDGPKLEVLRLPRGKSISCLWLLPVTKEEVEFKKKAGIEALEQRFESAKLNYLDPKRKSLC